MDRRHAFAAVALGSAALFLTSACGSSDSGAKSAASSAEPSVSAGSAAPSSPATPPPGTTAPASPSAAPTTPARSGNSPAPNAAKAPVARSTAKPGSASPISVRTLADGSKAEIYKLGDEHYRAKVVHNGELFVTLETHGQDAGLDANDMYIVLALDGSIHSWMGGGHQGPGTFKLAGGWTAKVTKLGELRYRAQILGNQGEVDATLETNQHDVGLDANGVYIVLSNGGLVSAHE